MFKDNGGWNGEGRLRVYFFTPGKEEDEKDVMAGFRTMCKEAPALAGRDVLCFKVKLKHHKKTHSRQLVLFIACPDDARLEEMLQFVTEHVDASPETSVFMTADNYGIQPKQSAGNAFMKYGNEFELHTGIHLNHVGWHTRN